MLTQIQKPTVQAWRVKPLLDFGIIAVEKVYALEIQNPHGNERHFVLSMSTSGNYMTTTALDAAFPFTESTMQAYRDQLLFLCGVNSFPVEICA